jgi:hypothetical protein
MVSTKEGGRVWVLVFPCLVPVMAAMKAGLLGA